MHKLWLSIAAFCVLLTGCAKPLPPEKAVYAGEWRSSTMALLITQGGSVMYKRVDGNMHKSINGPLEAFEGDNLIVGVGPIKTIFVVSTPPHEDHGAWKMVVDGLELTKMQRNY